MKSVLLALVVVAVVVGAEADGVEELGPQVQAKLGEQPRLDKGGEHDSEHVADALGHTFRIPPQPPWRTPSPGPWCST